MGIFDVLSSKKEVKSAQKEEKKAAKKEKLADALEEANDIRTDANKRTAKATSKKQQEEWYASYLEQNKLNIAIREARDALYIQRGKLVKRMIRFNKQYRLIQEKDPYPHQQRDLDRAKNESKNAAYALSVVCDAIERLDEMPDEFEWRCIMRDLTRGYKTVNAISTGSDTMTKLAFWLQKAQLEMQGDVSAAAIEQYYGKPIDELLNNENMQGVEEGFRDQSASQYLVKDEAVEFADEKKIIEAITGGSLFKIPPENVNKVADDQSRQAMANGTQPIIPVGGASVNPGQMGEIPTNLPK